MQDMEEKFSFFRLLMFRYTCEFNITQYGEDSMTDLTQYSEKVKLKGTQYLQDIFSLNIWFPESDIEVLIFRRGESQ